MYAPVHVNQTPYAIFFFLRLVWMNRKNASKDTLMQHPKQGIFDNFMQTKMPCIRTRKAFLTGLGFIVEEFQEFFQEEFKDYFKDCFLCDEPEMLAIMQYVEDLEIDVEKGAAFLPVFAPPGPPGMRKA